MPGVAAAMLLVGVSGEGYSGSSHRAAGRIWKGSGSSSRPPTGIRHDARREAFDDEPRLEVRGPRRSLGVPLRRGALVEAQRLAAVPRHAAA